jgi:hypothetical protein
VLLILREPVGIILKTLVSKIMKPGFLLRKMASEDADPRKITALFSIDERGR